MGVVGTATDSATEKSQPQPTTTRLQPGPTPPLLPYAHELPPAAVVVVDGLLGVVVGDEEVVADIVPLLDNVGLSCADLRHVHLTVPAVERTVIPGLPGPSYNADSTQARSAHTTRMPHSTHGGNSIARRTQANGSAHAMVNATLSGRSALMHDASATKQSEHTQGVRSQN